MEIRWSVLIGLVDIPLPSADGRRQLFTYNLGKIDVAEDVDYDRLVEATEVLK